MASGFYVANLVSIIPPATACAAFNIRTGGSTPAEQLFVYSFDDTTQEYMDYLFFLTPAYGGGGITIYIAWMATSATTGNVVWDIAIRRIQDDAEDMDSSHTYDYNTVTATTANVSGEVVYDTIAFTNGSDMDSWTTNENAIVRISRNAGSGSDTMTGDAELLGIWIKET